MLLPLKSQSLGQYNRKPQYVQKNFHLDQVVDRSNVFKTFFLSVFIILGDFYCFKSMFLSEAPTLRYNKCNNFNKIIIFTELCFCLHQLKKCVSDCWNAISNWRYYYFCPLQCHLCPKFSNKRFFQREKYLRLNLRHTKECKEPAKGHTRK